MKRPRTDGIGAIESRPAFLLAASREDFRLLKLNRLTKTELAGGAKAVASESLVSAVRAEAEKYCANTGEVDIQVS